MKKGANEEKDKKNYICSSRLIPIHPNNNYVNKSLKRLQLEEIFIV